MLKLCISKNIIHWATSWCIDHTGTLKTQEKLASEYWQNSQKNRILTRIYNSILHKIELSEITDILGHN